MSVSEKLASTTIDAERGITACGSAGEVPGNIAARLRATAERMGEAVAVVEQRRGWLGRITYRRATFRQLDEDSDRIAAGLAELGVQRGERLALLVRPSFDFISLVFGLFKAGAVQILIDPGMGRENLLRCLDEARPAGFVAISPVQAVRRVLGRRYAAATKNVTVGRRWFWGGPTLAGLRRRAWPGPKLVQVTGDEAAAIIFTTGSTGPPKGVLYRHGNFWRQVDEIRERFSIRPGEIDVACFPLFALFNAAMGVTTVIPAMDASRPAAVDPRNIIAAVDDQRATQAFGSPAVWDVVGRYCEQQGARLTSLRRVLSAGAPVPPAVLETMQGVIHPEGEIFTPYGATEALPVAAIGSREVLGETAARSRRGAGTCVGQRFAGIRWQVIRIVDGPMATLAEAEPLPAGEIGELIVQGPVVTSRYVTREEANAWAKIADGEGFWHRMGDVGYLDEQERFWFCGRMNHRVETAAGVLYSVPCEAIFEEHPAVRRAALVGVGPRGGQRPVLIVEPKAGMYPETAAAREKLLTEVAALGQAEPLTRTIGTFLTHRAMPVDIRHNSKIFREKLAVWAAAELEGESPTAERRAGNVDAAASDGAQDQ